MLPIIGVCFAYLMTASTSDQNTGIICIDAILALSFFIKLRFYSQISDLRLHFFDMNNTSSVNNSNGIDYAAPAGELDKSNGVGKFKRMKVKKFSFGRPFGIKKRKGISSDEDLKKRSAQVSSQKSYDTILEGISQMINNE